MSGGDRPPAGYGGPAPLAAVAAHGRRYRLVVGEPPAAEAGDWLAADRLLRPEHPGTDRLLDAEYHGSGHRTRHAAALTLAAVYAGRVTSAAVLLWAVRDQVLDIRPSNVLVRPSPRHGPPEVRLRVNRTIACGPDTTTDTLRRTVLSEHLLPLADALCHRTRAGRRQLYGGVAHGCATALCASAAPHPVVAERWREFVRGAPGGLARLGEVVPVTRADGSTRLVYLRRTCCLYYTSAEAVRCASCCLTSRAERLARYAAG